MNEKIINFLKQVKANILFSKEWIKNNGMTKIIGISALVGVLTFSSWASLFLAILLTVTYRFVIEKIPQAYLSLVNIDFNKYVTNVVIGLVLASIFLFIV